MRLGQAWGTIRGVIRQEFSFAGIKDIMGGAGLPVQALSHLQQGSSGYISKGQLMDAIDQVLSQQLPDDQDRIVAACITDAIGQRPQVKASLEERLCRVGWGVTGGQPHPLRLQIDVELAELPEPAAEGLRTALVRYRDGDSDGAVTAICGVVDSLTAAIYESHDLGNLYAATYQERVARAFSVIEQGYRARLADAGLSENEVALLWQNHRGAVNHAAYVLGKYRQAFADAHGAQPTPPTIVQPVLDCAVFIVRSLLTRA